MKKKQKIITLSLIVSFVYSFLFSYIFFKDLLVNFLIGIMGVLFAIAILFLMNVLEWD